MVVSIILFGAVVILGWVLPIKLGLKAASRNGYSPLWMLFGVHPISGWIACIVLAHPKPRLQGKQSISGNAMLSPIKRPILIVVYIMMEGILIAASALVTYYLLTSRDATPPAPMTDLGVAPAPVTQGQTSPPVTAGGGGPAAPAAPAAPTSPESVVAAADQGLALMGEGKLAAAQLRLSEALRGGIDGEKGKAVREALIKLADGLQLSSQCLPGDTYSKVHKVAQDENLTAIGQMHKIPYQLVKKINNLSTDTIIADQSLKVLEGPINIEIFKSRHELQVWLDKVCLGVYPIGIGADDSTPEGAYVVEKKLVNPPYQPQHKPVSAHKAGGAADNPLGTRWIDIGNHYGIHGTIDPPSIGKDVTEGCIRMNNADVEKVYDMVVSMSVSKSKVTIRP